jgi:1,4-alpha-glucan branching enzyme
MYEELYGMMNWPVIEGIEYTDVNNPHDVLGIHITKKGALVQAFIPDADKVQIKYSNKVIDMFEMDEFGFFAVLLDSQKPVRYKLIITKGENTYEVEDPYSFEIGSEIKELKKFSAGICYNAYEFMGAHKKVINNVEGMYFRVWAPEAMRVSVVGEFNKWDGRLHQMSMVEDTGIFEIFIPGIKEGAMYKYEIKKKGNENILKSDPFAFKLENQPGNATIIKDIDEYKWNDKDWINNRDKYDVSKSPLSIYEMSISSFCKNEKGEVNYRDIAKNVADYVAKMGYTHVELMPFAEYYNDNTSGYLVNYFYAPTNRYGSTDDLMYFIDYLHTKNIGVIIDWSVNQFTSDEAGMGSFDGSCLFEHVNPKRGINPRNGALLFNYGRPEVTSFLIANAFMWIEKYHIDGIKVVNTASMLYLDYDRKPGEWIVNIFGGNEDLEAIEFMKHFNSVIHSRCEGIFTIADDTSGFPELTGVVDEKCIGFDMKVNTEWRKTLLNFMSNPAYRRKYSYNDLSLSMIYQYTDNFIVGYPESEFIDGQASLVGRMTGDNEEMKFDNMKLAIAYEYVHPGKKVLFMGQDMAQYAQWFSNGSLDMNILNVDKHKNVNDMVKELNKIYKAEKSLYELDNDSEGFEWINNISANESILTFVRKGISEDDMLLVVCNFDNVDREDYKIGVPRRGKYKEIFNSDSKKFGGNDFVNSRLKQSKTDECDGREESVRVNVAALSVSIFKFSKADEKLATNKEAKKSVESKKKAEATKKVETTKKAEPAKKAEATKKAETTKKTEATKKAEPAKKAEATKKAEPAKKTEATKKAEPAKKTEATKKAEPAKKAEETKKAEPAKKAEVTKKASPVKKTEVAK